MAKLTTRLVKETKPTDSIIIKWEDFPLVAMFI